MQGPKSISKQTLLASVLFSRCRSSDNTPENWVYSRAHVCIIYEKTLGANSPGTLIGKTKLVLAKEVYRWIPFSRTATGRDKMLAKTKFRIFRSTVNRWHFKTNCQRKSIDNWTKFYEFCPQVFFTVLWVYIYVKPTLE